MAIPIVYRGKCSANVCPHTFGNCIQNTKLVFLAIYCSFPVSVKQNTPILLICSLLVNLTLFPWSLWRLSSWVTFDFMNTLDMQRQRLLDIEQQTWISEIHNDERKEGIKKTN